LEVEIILLEKSYFAIVGQFQQQKTLCDKLENELETEKVISEKLKAEAETFGIKIETANKLVEEMKRSMGDFQKEDKEIMATP
jgi:hypothetical protein